MAASIKIQIKGLDKLRTAFRKSPGIVRNQIQKAIAISVALVNREAKIAAPVKTSRLRTGIRSRISSFRGIVESTVAYGIYVHEGTGQYGKGRGAYIIRPVTKKALYWKGARHPVKSVRHPGIKPNPFMKKGADRAEGQIQAAFQRAINNVVNQLATK